MPSAIVAGASTDTGCPAASEGGYAAAPAACTPTTRTSGRSAFTATAIPAASPPPPMPDHDRAHLGALLQDLQPDRALPGDDVRVVEGVDEDRAGLAARTPARPRSVSSTTWPCSRTSAPYSRVAATFGSGAPTGMKTVERTPSSEAASATPCAWFPALAATTPGGPLLRAAGRRSARTRRAA